MQPLTFPRAGHGPFKRREMNICANNGLHACMEWYTTCSFSPCTAQELKFPKLTMTIQAM